MEAICLLVVFLCSSVFCFSRVTVSAEKNETFIQAVVQIIYTLLAGKSSSRTLTTSLESLGKALALVLLDGFKETCCSPLLHMVGKKRIPGLN